MGHFLCVTCREVGIVPLVIFWIGPHQIVCTLSSEYANINIYGKKVVKGSLHSQRDFSSLSQRILGKDGLPTNK